MVMTPTRLIVVPTHIDIVISTPILIDLLCKFFFKDLHIIDLCLVIILYTRSAVKILKNNTLSLYSNYSVRILNELKYSVYNVHWEYNLTWKYILLENMHTYYGRGCAQIQEVQDISQCRQGECSNCYWLSLTSFFNIEISIYKFSNSLDFLFSTKMFLTGFSHQLQQS